MKRIFALLIITSVFITCKSQYFKDFTYFKHLSGFDNFYPYDSIRVIFFNDSIENFRLFTTFNQTTNINAFLKIKLVNKKIYYQLANNSDTGYQLMFDLNAHERDSFYIKIFYFENYFTGSLTHNVKFDSFLCKIKKVDTINYWGAQRKTWKTEFDPNFNFNFIDSIGFVKYGLIPVKTPYSEVFNVCLNDSLVYKDSSRVPHQYFCDKDSFRKVYSSIETMHRSNDILIYPNPTCQTISINGLSSYLQTSFSLKVINCLGEIIPIDFEYAGNVISLNVSDLPPGIYTILINNNLKLKFVKDM